MTDIERGEVMDEIKGIVIKYLKTIDDDQFGYITEKINKIRPLSYDNLHYAFRILHHKVRFALWRHLSDNAKKYLVESIVFDQHGNIAV